MRGPERDPDDFQHRFGLLQEFVIPEAEDPVAACLKEDGPSPIGVGHRDVLASVELHDKPPFRTAEVGEERSDGMLAPELRAEELAVSQ